MSRTIITSRRALTVIVLLLIISSFLPAGAAGAVSGLPNFLVQAVLSPGSWVCHQIATTFRPGIPDQPGAPEGADSEKINLELRTYVAHLEHENEMLKQTLARWQFTTASLDPNAVRLLDAHVTMVSLDPNNPILTIDRGLQRGVNRGMAVVWRESLVGRVVAATRRNASIRLITVEEAGIGVRLVPIDQKPPDVPVEQLPGIIDHAKVTEDGQAFYIEVDQHEQVSVNDIAHLNDRLWPGEAQGFIVGYVSQITDVPENPKLLKRVIIKPIQPLRDLDVVTVLVPRAGEGD